MEATRSRSRRTGLLATLVAAGLLALVPAADAARGRTPNDRAFSAQWELASDSAMGARGAWATTTGGDVTVAVIDTGAQLDHPDLAPNLWTNTGEIPGNGIDDDHNGYVDDVHGYNFVAHNGDPTDDNGHGTNVAGVIAARGGNRLGVTGVAWQAKLMIVKALGADGSGSEGDVAAGILYAVRNGARIINLSMAGPQDDPVLESALSAARDAGVLVVAAAGNNGADLGTTPAYPASSPLDNVISVASTDESGRLAPDSAYGRTAVDVSAPGENIDSTALDGRYGTRSGTSQAAAHVSGVLALELAAKPTAGWQELRTALLSGSRAGSLPVAAGALDAAGALRVLTGAPASRSVRSAHRSVRLRTKSRAVTRRVIVNAA